MAYKKSVDDLTKLVGPRGVKGMEQYLDDFRLELELTDEQFTDVLNKIEKRFSPILERVVDEDRWYSAFSDHALQNSSSEIPPTEQTLPDPQPLEQRNPEPTAAPPITRNPDALLAEFKPGGSKYERWLKGDAALNAEHIALYNQKAGNKQIEITTEGTRTFNTENKENIS
jgi:hypothetical protein